MKTVEQLTARGALQRAAEWLEKLEGQAGASHEVDIARATAAHAYAAFALSMVAWDGTLDVRARVESGI